MLALVAATAVAVVLMTSAVAKWRHGAETTRAAEAFGLPLATTSLIAAALPPVELAVGTALLFRPAEAAWAALVLLAAFGLVVVRVLHQGRSVQCGCFGALSRAEVSGWTVARIGALMVAAGLATTADTAVVHQLGAGGTPDARLSIVLGVVLAAALVWLEAAHARRPARPDDLRGLPLARLDGSRVTLRDCATRGGRQLVVVLSTTCGSCHVLAPAVRRWHEHFGARIALATVVVGDPTTVRRVHPEPWNGCLLADPDAAFNDAASVEMTPAALVLDDDGLVAAGPSYGEEAIRALLVRVLGETQPLVARTEADQVRPRSRLLALPHVSAMDQDGDGGLVLCDERDGSGLALDPIGSLVWSSLDGATSVRELADELAATFGAPADVVHADVLELLRGLADHGVVGLVQGEGTRAVRSTSH